MATAKAPKTIVVFGGLGVQGGALVSALLKRGSKYLVRIATRDATSAGADQARSICEVVSADYANPASLREALKGAYGAWFITWHWEVKDEQKEIDLGRNVVQAAKEAGVKHLVFSTLESPRRNGAGFDFPAFDAKVGVEEEIVKAGVPYTFVNVAWYLNNLETFEKPKKRPDGKYVINFPIGSGGLHAIHNADVGECFAQVFDHPEEFLGKKIGLAGMLIKDGQKEIAAAFSEVFAPLQFVHDNDLAAYEKDVLSKGFGDATLRMYKWYMFRNAQDCDVALTRRLNPDVKTSVKDYLIANRHKFHFD